MKLSDAIVSAGRAIRRRPADLLPLYALNSAVPVVTRVITMVGLVVSYLYLETTGRLQAVRTEFEDGELTPPDPEAEQEAFTEWFDAVGGVLETLFPPTVVAILVVAFGLSILASILLRAGVAAGQVTACYALLREKRGLREGVPGIRRYWPSFLGLLVLEGVIWGGATALAGSIVAAAYLVEPVLAVLAAAVAVPAWLVVVLVARAVFAFAPVAVVVDGAGALGSLWRSVGFIGSRPLGALAYYFLAIVAVFGVAGLSSVLAIVGAGSIVGLLVVFLAFPWLDLLKTALYAGDREDLEPLPTGATSLPTQFVAGLRGSWTELVAFVRERPGLHAVAVAVAIAGFWTGWAVAEPYVGVLPASISARVAGQIPPAAALEYFTNNWLVAIATGYAGVVLAVPTALNLWFNGVVFGLYARLEVDPLELIAFVVPHGIVEIPALLIAGAVGLHLGIVGWKTLRGRAEAAVLADEMERAFRILVGVGLLLLLAGLIEGFVSPYYYRLFL